MSEMLLPPNAGAPPAGPPPDAGAENPLTAAMGAGPGGADTAQLPPELAAALGGGAPEAESGPGEGAMEPASLEAAMEHFRMGIQMLQELQVSSTDDRQQHELGGLMAPITKMLADRAKNEAVSSASGPALGGGSGGA